ncbi:NAD(P)H-hydrate dehydratase [Alteriqipengyuania sp.]|uniref:NAD(P)H-hydrate dehydratase n=1 Tax=Alteriqipengyuania sp. TaxID=2800692 RepID=UPI0035135635
MTVSQMRAAEAAMFDSGIEEWALMQRAGQGAADWIMRIGAGGPVTVLCGPGHNGGDGYVAAAALKARGVAVRVVAPTPSKTELARHAASTFDGEVLEDARDTSGSVFVDALFGIGLSRPLSDDHRALLTVLHASHRHSVALDVPSGVDADTGDGPDDLPAFDLTLAFGAWKPAHFSGRALAKIGVARLVDIGIGDQGAAMQLASPAKIPPPAFDAHKYTRGLVAVVGGAMPGATLLAARAAALAGAGYVKWLSEHDHPGHPPDLVRVDGALDGALSDTRIGCVLIGPGLGRDDQAKQRLEAALACGKSLVLDADALHLLRPAMIDGREASNMILTPHEGELARLCDAFGVKGDTKRERALALAERIGCAVLAKGPDTILAHDGQIRFFRPASRWLSVAGSGDVLAGVASARLAATRDPLDAACEAVHLHSDAARWAGAGFTAAMLAEAVHPALANLT